MKIGIGLKKAAYTPEAYAYCNYLSGFGHEIQLESENQLYRDNDINIYYMGFRPFWRNDKSQFSREVHEYQSLSTPPYAALKDFIKTKLNNRPSGRIFLNSIVEKKLGFSSNIPSITRDMGIDDALFLPPPKQPEYDLIYCGSIFGRKGLLLEIERLAKMGFKILVVGSVSSEVLEQFSTFNQVIFTGKVSRNELPTLFQKAKAGLNYTPDIYPFNIQTSTKTLEYLAAGLGVVSNSYSWIREFSQKYRFSPLWTNDILDRESLLNFNFEIIDVRSFSWNSILSDSDLNGFLTRIHQM